MPQRNGNFPWYNKQENLERIARGDTQKQTFGQKNCLCIIIRKVIVFIDFLSDKYSLTKKMQYKYTKAEFTLERRPTNQYP